jgi:hypothetical protein
MRIGTSSIFLVIIMIGFGYVLSDNGHMRNDLGASAVQVEGLNAQVVDTDQKLKSCQALVQEGQQVLSRYSLEIASLNNAIALKEGQIGFLMAENSEQSGRIKELEGHFATSPEANPEPQTVQSASAWLPSNPILWVVIVMMQIGFFLLQRRHNNDYVRLSEEERAHIIRRRRMKKM